MFLQRDEKGKIRGLYANIQDYAIEQVPDDHPEILAFLNRFDTAEEQAKRDLAASDVKMARVAEDIFDLLKANGVIHDGDQAMKFATEVVAMRKELRKKIK
jgi:hypothetical protein